ncbi:amino acid adenylation domain-containing protein [Streptomyces sp. CRN 30]|uniref:non-ribosomal peptide synthetase n=1 Tax=Streptomyces sp. CRN 30 TaxID=3075613 RepID=UPI002A82883A|nr:amino acid adenylation domain-containing protein [Streptomyces sp. CRN 30]
MSTTTDGTTTPAYARARDRRLHELFDARAAERGEAAAARHHGRELTYARLRRRSDALAARLVRAGVRRGTPVGICGHRSLEALVGLVGVLKAGGCYVPLDDGLPVARLRAMAEDADVRTVVVLPDSPCRLRGVKVRVDVPPLEAPGHDGADDGAAAHPPVRGDARDCAYVMYTSGSSGRPKPVAVPHRAVVRLALSEPTLPPPGPDDVVLHGYALSSDASTIEIWNTLLGGARLELVDREELVSPPALAERLRGVTVAYLTTSVFHHMARSAPEALRGLRQVSAGGEAMDAPLARAVLAACPHTTVVNFYGPTENAVVSTFHLVRGLPDDAVTVPVGRAYGASVCHVLLPDGAEAATGEPGELAVGGDGLALGYLNDPRLTAERFVHVPRSACPRLYRTGDRVTRRADGVLEYLGRMDRQLKIRGHRVEPDEVETHLRAHPDVAEAVVEPSADGGALHGFVTPARPGRPPEPERVRQYCAQWLPAQMMPHLTVVDAFPVTAAGKVDRAALRAAAATRHDPAVPAPRTPDGGTPENEGGVPGADRGAPGSESGVPDAGGTLVRLVADIWETVLRTPPAPADDFFALGGDSLLAAEVVNRTVTALRLDAAHGTGLVRSLLTAPTPAAFARTVRGVVDGTRPAAPHAATDFEGEAALGFTPPEPVGPPPRPGRPRAVLLTGASGFVGAFLLERLLRTTDARVHCPVRARSADHARRRVRAALDHYGLDPELADPDRVDAFPYDLTAPYLGLSPERTARLTEHTDLVLHGAAQVNFLYPYSALRAANVAGTRELLRLAAPRRVPVHFLSTVAVLAGFGTAGVRAVGEDTELAHADRLTMGYAESKWVGERLLRHAALAGLPVSVHRPYEITGDTRSGACNTETAICSLFRMVAETGLAPDIALPMDFVPVDHLAAAVVHIATREPAGHTYHLTNPRPALLGDVLDRMEEAGYRLRRLPYADWVAELVRHVARNPTSATAPFVSLCVDRGHKADITVKEMYLEGTFPRLSRERTDAALRGSGLVCPPVDTALLDCYLGYLMASGYLPPPSGDR